MSQSQIPGVKQLTQQLIPNSNPTTQVGQGTLPPPPQGAAQTQSQSQGLGGSLGSLGSIGQILQALQQEQNQSPAAQVNRNALQRQAGDTLGVNLGGGSPGPLSNIMKGLSGGGLS